MDLPLEALTVRQAADLVGMSPLALVRRIQRGYLKGYKVGWVWLIPREEVAKIVPRSRKLPGKINHPLYQTWRGMMSRCYHSSDHGFSQYGGRGVEVDKGWHDFGKFVEDVGPKPEGAVLSRLNKEKPYSPDNCRWEVRGNAPSTGVSHDRR